MYHSYISSLILPLRGLKAEGQLRLASREIQYFVTEIPGKAMGRGKKIQTPENLEKQLNVSRQFGLNPHISLTFQKPENRNWEVTYQYLTPRYSPRISCSHKGIWSPPKSQQDSSFPGKLPPATWAGSPVTGMVRLIQSQIYICTKFFPWIVPDTY